MILPASRRPDRSHLAQTGTQAEVAGDAEDKAVEESGWAAGWEDDGQSAREGYPCAVERVVSWSFFMCYLLGIPVYFRIAKAMPVMVSFENFFSS
jgi:hypothetical protein